MHSDDGERTAERGMDLRKRGTQPEKETNLIAVVEVAPKKRYLFFSSLFLHLLF